VRGLTLSKSGFNKIRSQQFELKASDFEDSIKSIPPGDWFSSNLSESECLVGYINPLIEDKYTCAHVVTKLPRNNIPNFSVEEFLAAKLNKAHEKRRRIIGYEKNSRLFYGVSDGLPGLIVDQFENAVIVQINTAGLDRYRELIQNTLSEITKTPAYLLDNPKYREKESLPTYSTEELPDLEVYENGLRYKIRKEVLQKVGFYYDHRENRLQLMNLLSRLKECPSNGIDLFSYAGAWGMSALKAGVKNIQFVDQGDFAQEVEGALQLNGFSNKGSFKRLDVFKFLDEAIKKSEKYNLVLCDPPAFAKSALHKPQAIEGYSKLHRKVFKILAAESIVAFSSCTHYVSHGEFQKNILDSAQKENRKVQLVYCGIQGLDHPISSLEDKSSYIKSYFYIVE
jgi:23S rRNA (cytosine1962-C5)-methyltransferase